MSKKPRKPKQDKKPAPPESQGVELPANVKIEWVSGPQSQTDLHFLANNVTVLSSTPESERRKWIHRSHAVLRSMVQGYATDIENQYEIKELDDDGPLRGMTHLVARIRFRAKILPPDVLRIKHEGEMMDAALRTPTIDVKRMH